MLEPFGYLSLRLAKGRDLYQPNLGPHWCFELGGRHGAGRLNGSNGPTRLVHYITKRIFLMLDPFGYSPLWLASERDLYQPNLCPQRCLEPWGRLWAGRLNGSNGPTKLVHFIIKLIFLMLDPFGYSPLRPAPGQDLYQPNLGPHKCLEPGGRPGAGRLFGSNGPTISAHFIIKLHWYFWCWTRLDIRPYGLLQDGTYTNPIKNPIGAWNQDVILGQAVLMGQMDQQSWRISS